MDEYRSRVYTDRPDYADFDSPQKFSAILSIVGRRLTEHPNAICSYSGGSDSDILLDVIERAREMYRLPPVKYVFFNTGLEMKATKDHVKAMLDFIRENPPDFRISAERCTHCKKNPAHRVQKDYEMIITGERRDEGGMRSVPRKDNTALCFGEMENGQFRLRPLYYVSDGDKAWYRRKYDIHYSDAYEVYGLTRTGCCGCPISHKAIRDLELIAPYEPNVVKAAWAIFGDSYRYRMAYNAYKEKRKNLDMFDGKGVQMSMDEII